MQQRSDNAILPYLAAAGIILFTPIFFILAVWVYKIVRPHEKIGEVWERNLAEEALLAEVESIHHCPSCERRIDDEWIICPSCRTRLKRVCPNCSRLVGMDWSLCAWCGKDFERREVAAAATSRRCRPAVSRPAGSGADADDPVADPDHRRPPARPFGSVGTPRRAGSAARALIPRDPADPPDDPIRGRIRIPGRARSGADRATGRRRAFRSAHAPARPDDGSPPPARPDDGSPPPARPGAGTFTIEGRAAPGLFVVGWLATLIGVVGVFVAVHGGRRTRPRSLLLDRPGPAVDRADRRRRLAGIERRARGRAAYRGPSPLLVFAASVPVSLSRSSSSASRWTSLGIAFDGPVGRLAVGHAPGDRLYRRWCACSWSTRAPSTGRTMGIRRARIDGGSPTSAAGCCGRCRSSSSAILVAAVLAALLPVTPVSPLPPTGDDRPASSCRWWPACSSRRSARRSCSAGSRRPPGLRGIGHRRALVRGALFFAFAHVLTIAGHDRRGRARARDRGLRGARSRSPSRSAGCSCDAARSGPRSACTPRSTGSSCWSSSPRPIGGTATVSAGATQRPASRATPPALMARRPVVSPPVRARR